MIPLICFAIAFVQFSPSESGVIKDLIYNISDSAQASNIPPPKPTNITNNYKNTTWFIENEDYLTPNNNMTNQKNQGSDTQFSGQGSSNKKDTYPQGETSTVSGGFQSSQNNFQKPGQSSTFGNKRPSTGESNFQNNIHNRPSTNGGIDLTQGSDNNYNRPGSQQSNFGSFHNRPGNQQLGFESSYNNHNRPGQGTTQQIINFEGERPSSIQNSQRPNQSGNIQTSQSKYNHGGNHQSGFGTNKPSTISQTGSQVGGNRNNQGYQQRREVSNSGAYNNLSERTSVKSETPSKLSESADSVILQSDAVRCRYSNTQEVIVENRSLTCNEKKCTLENNSDKSSLWVCQDIKCTVANVDFSEDLTGKKVMECSMDARNIINVQNKPLKCGPEEKEHNGRCRRVFGA